MEPPAKRLRAEPDKSDWLQKLGVVLPERPLLGRRRLRH